MVEVNGKDDNDIMVEDGGKYEWKDDLLYESNRMIIILKSIYDELFQDNEDKNRSIW